MRARLFVVASLVFAIVAGGVAWVLNAPLVNHWLAVHTGIVDMSGPYYAFWSGFGSDIAEFGLVGTAVAGVYQLNRKSTAISAAAGASAPTLRPAASSCFAPAITLTTKERSRPAS